MQKPLVYAHIGDLHINDAKEQNYVDFLAIVSQIEMNCKDGLDFVYLPGDVADHAQKFQYKLVATALKMLSIPVLAIAGDHDMEGGSLASFYELLGGKQMPFAEEINGMKCYFLDVCGNGTGGPDFRLGNQQLQWFADELGKGANKASALFMHTYPDDLKDDNEKQQLLQLIANHNVALADMGHTHYNELANDGNTIYAATRSTGQIEEGAVGYSIVSVDNGVVSWRFRNLADAFPFVLITQPADYRLWRKENGDIGESVVVKAVVLGERRLHKVHCICNDGEPVAMNFDADANVWYAQINLDGSTMNLITVEAIDVAKRKGIHTIQTGKTALVNKVRNGSDADSIGAWAENGILGTQLGPNRNAKPIEELRKKGLLQS